jgi:hypothetical protein
MTDPRSDDLQRSRHEAALLLRLDPTNLSPSDALRCDLVATLRLSIDSAQADALEGRAADLGRLIVATESLVKLLPSEPPQPATTRDDPREYMWRTYLEMRRRGEIGNAAVEAREVDRLRARVAELEGELAGHLPAESAPPAPAAPAPGGNVVPLKPAQAAPEEEYEEVVVTEAVLGQPEPWRSYVGGPDNSIISTPGKRWWGPVGS